MGPVLAVKSAVLKEVIIQAGKLYLGTIIKKSNILAILVFDVIVLRLL